MVAIDAQLAVLAAQCMLTLVSTLPSAAAIAVRSHPNHGEAADPLNHHQKLLLPAEKKHYSSGGSHHPNSASKKHHQREESSEFEIRSLLSVPASSSETEQSREQSSFQARNLPSRGSIDSILNPLLQQVLSGLKPVLGNLPSVDAVLEILRPILADILNTLLGDAAGVTKNIGARHHRYDHYDHDHEHYREEIDIHEHFHDRAHFEHVQPSNGERRKRDSSRGIISAVSKDVVAYLSANDNFSELGASEAPDTATTFLLYDVPWSPSSLTSSVDNLVMLRVEQACSNTANGDSGECCATYDPKPLAPSTLKLTRCFTSANDATEHEDQVFLLDPVTNQLQPRSSDNTTSTHQDVRMNSRDNDDSSNEVTLVFNPAPAIAAEALPTSSDTRSQASLTTVTVTTTATKTELPSVAAIDTTPSPTSTGSSSSLSPSSLPSPASLDVEVALQSISPSVTESFSSTSPSSIASTSQAVSESTTVGVSPSPVSLLFEVKEKWSTMTV